MNVSTLKAVSPAVLWAIFIFIISVANLGVNLPESLFDLLTWDKVAHAGVYFILAVLMFWGVKQQTGELTQKAVIWIIIITILYGISIEFIQKNFFPNRYFEVFDIIANIIGTIGSLLTLKFIR